MVLIIFETCTSYAKFTAKEQIYPASKGFSCMALAQSGFSVYEVFPVACLSPNGWFVYPLWGVDVNKLRDIQ